MSYKQMLVKKFTLEIHSLKILLFYVVCKVEEIYRFSQDDLLTEDMLILDTRAEVMVWVGQLVDNKEKQTAFEIGQVVVLLRFSFAEVVLSMTLLY